MIRYRATDEQIRDVEVFTNYKTRIIISEGQFETQSADHRLDGRKKEE